MSKRKFFRRSTTNLEVKRAMCSGLLKKQQQSVSWSVCATVSTPVHSTSSIHSPLRLQVVNYPYSWPEAGCSGGSQCHQEAFFLRFLIPAQPTTKERN